ncbi:PREDICTED: uncharacterized protein LOC106743912 [Dinoponera quadriceps]|uniref:Uncharacterized protein LOC106743912 n=1 Tax=Dinoponera quadriceps TaxID=609295 RepID=A0A6P3X746_DINQU|nr:PREDICTED: uncharacterized protein LOC106743912 [Dinoponera quadriceps]
MSLPVIWTRYVCHVGVEQCKIPRNRGSMPENGSSPGTFGESERRGRVWCLDVQVCKIGQRVRRSLPERGRRHSPRYEKGNSHFSAESSANDSRNSAISRKGQGEAPGAEIYS